MEGTFVSRITQIQKKKQQENTAEPEPRITRITRIQKKKKFSIPGIVPNLATRPVRPVIPGAVVSFGWMVLSGRTRGSPLQRISMEMVCGKNRQKCFRSVKYNGNRFLENTVKKGSQALQALTPSESLDP